MKIINQLLHAAMMFVDVFAGIPIKRTHTRITVGPWHEAALRGQVRFR
jgi:hypothetical protein